MAFSRQFLIDNGVPEDKVDTIMRERNLTLEDYVHKDEVQNRINTALKDHKPDPIDPTTTEQYQTLARERDMLRAIGGEDFANVKPKFRETVFNLLDRGEKAKPVAEQLKSIGEKYEEYFQPAQQQPKPTFGSPDQGGMPKGDEGAVSAFEKAWGFVPTKK